jgi:putative endopeptidase
VQRHIAIATLALAVGGLGGCRTPQVKPASTPGIDPSLFDASVKPCDDFYSYACGGWISRTALPPDKPKWTRSFTDIEERNLKLLRAIAEEDAAGKLDREDRYPQKVGDFWAACMDEAGIEQRGLGELRAAWARIDGVKDVESLARQIALLHKVGFFPVFQIASDQDAKDARQVIGVIEQGGLSLPDRDYYLKEDPRTAAIQKSYRAHVARMFELAGERTRRPADTAAVIYGLERSLAEAQWSRVEMRDPQRTYNRLDLPGLEQAAPRFRWKAYLAVLGHPGVTAFSATTPRYLGKVNELLAKVPVGTWRAYLKWRLLSGMAAERALPKAFTEERFAFLSKNFTGTKELEPRWKHCVRATEEALGEAIGQAYVRRAFGADGKQKTSQLVSDIEGAMGRDLSAVTWMDGATRQHSLEKLHRINNKIGYPDSWRNYDALQVNRGSLFQSVLAANAFEVNRDLDKIGRPLDRNEWRMVPPQVNAYYDPAMNEMVFPAGILQPPFFTRGAPDAVNYGAIGMVVGHELTHGFDDEGRQFDAEGNLRDWWTSSVAKEFDRRAECVANQYDGYTVVDDVKLNGRLTLGENIADLGGVKLAFSAYQASRAGKRAELPVAGFTPEQAFFISYAQAWCTAIRPEFARLLVQTDAHSSARWRVNGPLSNLPDFQRAFACPAGSAMVRSGEKQCDVW